MTTKITDKNISSLANAGVSWQSVVVADGSTGLTAVAGRGYFIDTTSGAITVTLPTSPNVGDVVVLKDYARKWATNNVNIASTTLDGVTNTPIFSTNGQTVTLVFMDNTKGFSLINEDTTTNLGAEFISATGGTETTSGDFKIHSFTGDGCFVVATLGNPVGSTTVDYLVVAGGGGGGANRGGGGGAGGFREGRVLPAPQSPYAASPLAASGGLPVSATTYPITVGGGGTGSPCGGAATRGSNSVFSTITSAGGGIGTYTSSSPISPGGSGGGGGISQPVAGTGNTPPTSPPQGNNGGSGDGSGGGGGGATSVGSVGGPGVPSNGGDGGSAATTAINATSTTYAGGGGGGSYSGAGGVGGGQPSSPLRGGGGPGGGDSVNGTAGTTNTGGGAGGGGSNGATGAAGGKGIVIIRYKFQ